MTLQLLVVIITEYCLIVLTPYSHISPAEEDFTIHFFQLDFVRAALSFPNRYIFSSMTVPGTPCLAAH